MNSNFTPGSLPAKRPGCKRQRWVALLNTVEDARNVAHVPQRNRESAGLNRKRAQLASKRGSISGSALQRGDPAALKLDAPALVTHDAGMTSETLLDLDNRRPFQPYSLRLDNGDVVRVEQAEHCLVTEDGRTLVFNESGGKLKFIAIANITMVE
ncbi:MAG: hypothetical protein EXS31_08815 [Pedosphaera sp.]|nr:hypothetical protein [Pedosphaera sp.]